MSERGGFKSKFGLIAAVGGSVVGLGNIWRFPYLAGENGGAAFIIIYIAICLFISVPVMISEISIGRMGQKDVVNSYRALAGNRRWDGAGFIGVLASFVMLSFYCVVGGWALHFVKESLFNNLAGLDSEGVRHSLDMFVNSGWQPVIWSIIFVIATSIIVAMGIEKGIEKYNKVFMPMIVIILLGMFFYSFSMSGFNAGVSFLLKPDFTKITPMVVLQALGQSFFSLSLGMGTMITYGSYINRKADIGKLATTISLTDMCVAVLSGLAIFPAVFSMGISPTSGPDLVFITLPSVFNQMGIGYFISLIFFILLFIAAITSSVSLVEVIITYLKDEFKIRRPKGVVILTLILFVSCSFSALSQMEGSTLTIAGTPLFDFYNNVSGMILMPLGGLLPVIFIGWFLAERKFRNEITNGGELRVRLYHTLRFIIKFVAPIFIITLFLNLLGII